MICKGKYFTVFFLLVFNLVSTAQIFKKDMQQAKNTFKGKLKFDLAYNLYASSSNKSKAVQSYTGKYYIWDEMSSYRSDDLDLITNHKLHLSVDHKMKVVLINKVNKGNKSNKLMDELSHLLNDSQRTKFFKDSLLFSDSISRKWRVFFKKDLFGLVYIDVMLKLPEYQIVQVSYQYSKTFQALFNEAPDGVSPQAKPFLEINFNNYNKLTETERDRIFAESSFISLDNKGKATLMSPYKDYELSNYYNLKP